MGFKRVARSIGTRLVRRRPLLLPQLERRRELDFYCLVSDSRSFECVPPRSKLGITPESPSHSSARCQEHSKFLACITFHRFGKRRSASNTATMTNARIPIKKSVVIRDSLIVPKGRINKQRIPPRCSVRRKNCHGADLGRTEPVGGNEHRR